MNICIYSWTTSECFIIIIIIMFLLFHFTLAFFSFSSFLFFFFPVSMCGKLWFEKLGIIAEID